MNLTRIENLTGYQPFIISSAHNMHVTGTDDGGRLPNAATLTVDLARPATSAQTILTALHKNRIRPKKIMNLHQP